jgi:hypothetical protein
MGTIKRSSLHDRERVLTAAFDDGAYEANQVGIATGENRFWHFRQRAGFLARSEQQFQQGTAREHLNRGHDEACKRS